MTLAYQLKDGVHFVAGATRGAVLDTHSGKVYSVNAEACAVLRHEVEDDPYWDTLVSLKLAERAGDEARASALPKLKRTDRLEHVWLEVVTDDCNERCAHCYSDSMPRAQRRSLPVVRDETRPRMKHADWLALMEEAVALGARSCQLIGGEPFLYKGSNGETLLDLVLAAKERGFKDVEIFTNATLITPEKAARLAELGAGVAVSLYSDDPEVHDAVTRTPGSHARTMAALELLKGLGVRTRVELILMRPNQHTIESTVAFKRKNGWGSRLPDPLRPKGRGDNPDLMPDFEKLAEYGLMLGPNFGADRTTIARYASGNACLLGKISATEHGDVMPCIFTRDHTVGNVLASGELAPIVRGPELQRIWSSTKDQVMVCRDCEYRYVCFDCRPLSEAAAGGNAGYLEAPYPRCTYNPYTGEWRAGLWKVDEEGQPVYDRSRAEQIQAVAAGRRAAPPPQGH